MKRTFILTLLVMLCSLAFGQSTNVAKIGELEYATLSAAIGAASAGSTITFIADITEDVTVSKAVTIDGAGKTYTGTMTAKANLTVTVKNVKFYNGGFTKERSSTGTYTISNCEFDGAGTYIYAIALPGASTITIEDCAVKNYYYGFLYVSSSLITHSVKNVTVENCGYGVRMGSTNTTNLEGFVTKNVSFPVQIQANASRTVNMTGCKFENTSYGDNALSCYGGTSNVTFNFKGTNEIDKLSSVNNFIYTLGGEAILAAPAGFDFGDNVVYDYIEEIEKYGYIHCTNNDNGVLVDPNGNIIENFVAEVGGTNYISLADAVATVPVNSTVEVLAEINLEDETLVITEEKNFTLDLNGYSITAASLDIHGNLAITGEEKLNADVILAKETATLTAENSSMNVITTVAGYKVVYENGTYKLVKKISGEIAYRAYVTDNETTEAISVDLKNIYASQSLKVELYNEEQLLVTTEYAKNNFPIDAETFTCFMILNENSDEYWNTTINNTLTVDNAPTIIKLYVDDELVNTYDNALGAGTNVDETAKYFALDCVYKVAKIGETYYTSFASAYNAAQAGETITLFDNVKLTGKHTIAKGITIDGNGYSIIADETAVWYTVGNFNIKKYKTHLIGVNSANVTLKNIVLDCNDNAAGINIYCAQNVVFDNVSIINATKGMAALTVNGSTLTTKTSFKALGNSIAIDISNGSGVTSDLGLIVEEATVFNLDNKTVKFASVAANDVTNAVDADGNPYFAAMDNAYYYTIEQIKSRTTAFSNGLTLLADVTIDNKSIMLKGTLNLNSKTITLNGGNIEINGNTTIQNFGAIIFVENNCGIKLLGNNYTLTAPEGLNVITSVDGYIVVYENGVYKSVEPVAEVGMTKYATIDAAATEANATAGNQTIVVLKTTVAVETLVVPDDVIDLNGKTLTADILGTVNTNGGLWVTPTTATSQGYKMVGKNNEAIYYTEDATIIMGADYTLTMAAGEVELAATEWWTLSGQNLTIAENAEFTIPYGKKFNVMYGTTVTVEGAAINEGTLVIYGAAINEGTFTLGENGEVVLAAAESTLTAPAGLNVTSGVDKHVVKYANGVYSLSALQVVEIKSGWNWFSYYRGDNILGTLQEQLLNNGGNQIKSHKDGFTFNNGTTGWEGNLESTSPTKMYMIHNKAAATVEIEGDVFDYTNTAITINSGWNWIGYPVSEKVSVNAALANIDNPQVGDRIKDREGYAEYVYNEEKEESCWSGSLQTLEPGKGYIYYRSGSGMEFTYNVESRGEVKANITADNNYWVPNSAEFANNMTMTAVLNIDGNMMKEGFEVAAFANGEVRGSARPIFVEAVGQYMLFMTIYGEGNEELTFKCYDIYSDEEYTLGDRMVYADDAMVGSIGNPYVLTLNTMGMEENAANAISIYPNPTTTNTAISFETVCDMVEVFNSLGAKVAEYSNVDRIDGVEAAGVYVIRVTNGSTVQNCRLIVK